MGRRLVVAGGTKPQVRRASKRSFTKAGQARFLSVLAETCNVTEAARQADVSVSYAYRKKASDARFRAGWSAAIGTGYSRLELVLLDRAFNGTEKVITRKDGSEERMLEYSNQLGLQLLKMHRDSAVEANTEHQPEDVDELRERLIKKLKRLKIRHGQDES
jgi:hypothetical protein